MKGWMILAWSKILLIFKFKIWLYYFDNWRVQKLRLYNHWLIYKIIRQAHEKRLKR